MVSYSPKLIQHMEQLLLSRVKFRRQNFFKNGMHSKGYSHRGEQHFSILRPCLFQTNTGGLQIIIINSWKSQMAQGSHKHKNAKISVKRRQHLVELILEKNLTLCKAAKKLNIKFSTARLIYKKYEETGTYFNKNMNKVDKQQKEQGRIENSQSPIEKDFSSKEQFIKLEHDSSNEMQPTEPPLYPVQDNYFNYWIPNCYQFPFPFMQNL